MATSQSQSFRGGSVSPGTGLYHDDIKVLDIQHTDDQGHQQTETYDPLQGETFKFGRVAFRMDGVDAGSYDPFDQGKVLELGSKIVRVPADLSSPEGIEAARNTCSALIGGHFVPILYYNQLYWYYQGGINGAYTFHGAFSKDGYDRLALNSDNTYALLHYRFTTNKVRRVTTSDTWATVNQYYQEGHYIILVEAGGEYPLTGTYTDNDKRQFIFGLFPTSLVTQNGVPSYGVYRQYRCNTTDGTDTSWVNNETWNFATKEYVDAHAGGGIIEEGTKGTTTDSEWTESSSGVWEYATPHNNSRQYLYRRSEDTLTEFSIKLPQPANGETIVAFYKLACGTTNQLTKLTLKKYDGTLGNQEFFPTSTSIIEDPENHPYSHNTSAEIYLRNCKNYVLRVIGETYELLEVDAPAQFVTPAEMTQAINTLKSRMLYTLDIGAIQAGESINCLGNGGTFGCHYSLFSPIMDFDVFLNTTKVLIHIQQWSTSTSCVIAFYEYDSQNSNFKWVANTNNIAAEGGNGLKWTLLADIDPDFTQFSSDHLYLAVILGDVNGTKFLGNTFAENLNSAPLLLAGVKKLSDSGSPSRADSISTNVPTITPENGDQGNSGNKRLFFCITNATLPMAYYMAGDPN